MYRLLAANDQTRERRNQRVHPMHSKPKLLAVRPNEVWSWDICRDPLISCSGEILLGETHEHGDGRRDQTMDSAA